MLLVFLSIGGVAAFLGLHLDIQLLFYIGMGTVAYGILTTIGWALARYVIPGNRVLVARQIIAELELSGSEQVLDVGSGRGLYAIEAARKLTSGRVIGVDIWDPAAIDKLIFHHKFSQPTGNTIENACNNAVLAGVSRKIDFINMDAAHLQFSDQTFNVVVGGFVLSHLWRDQESVLREIRRVLKVDGRMLIIDNVRDWTYFLLSTPHMFVWSYLRGRKAKRLSRKNWLNTITRSGLRVQRCRARRGIITIVCTKVKET
jgi:ubiquinone/menaquinone biosynthesis C-methylase UbiE